jgi:hypothetical protein
MSQLYTIHTEAQRGVSLFDGAILAGLTEEQAEAAMKMPQVRQVYLSGRAEGTRMIREKLTQAANQGNVSAMKCLKLHEDAEEPERDLPAVPTVSPAERKRQDDKWMKGFEKRWERMSEISGPLDEGGSDATH